MKIRRNKTPKVYLQPGEMLGDVRYRIDSLWEDNDITITYHGYDTFRKKEVVIRELFPQAIMTRDYDRDYEVVCKKLSDEAVFEGMKEHMIARAKKLIKLYPIEGIANVLTYFEEHGTIYIVEEEVKGQTLKEYFYKRHSAKFTVEDIMKQMGPVMDVLNLLHAKGLVHACLTPENIVITPEKKIVLLQMMNPIDDLTYESLGSPKIRQDGFSPVEMYLPQAKRSKQTDIYEVAAIIYYYVTGRQVPAYYQRINESEQTVNPADSLSIIMDCQSDAIMKAINIYDFARYASLDEFRAQICPADIDLDSLHDQQETVKYQKTKPKTYARNERKKILVALIVIIALIVMVPKLFRVGEDEKINHFYRQFVKADINEQCILVLEMDKSARQTYTNDYYDMDQSKDDETLSNSFQAKYYDFQLKRYVTADEVDTDRPLYEYLKIDYRRTHVIVTYMSNKENWTNDISLTREYDGSYKVERFVTDENGSQKTENLTIKP